MYQPMYYFNIDIDHVIIASIIVIIELSLLLLKAASKGEKTTKV